MDQKAVVDDSHGSGTRVVRSASGICPGLRTRSIYLHAVLDVDREIANYFDQLAADWSSNYRSKSLFADRLGIISNFFLSLELSGPMVLDVGCGSGRIAMELAGRNAIVFGTDISERMIRYAKRTADTSASPVRYTRGSATSLPYRNSTFDVVVSASVVEWIDQDQQAILEMARVLKPGGKILISVPNRKSFFRLLEKWQFKSKLLCRHFVSVKLGYLEHQKHQYTVTTISKMLHRASFAVDRVAYYAGPASTIGFIRRLNRFPSFGMLMFILASKRG